MKITTRSIHKQWIACHIRREWTVVSSGEVTVRCHVIENQVVPTSEQAGIYAPRVDETPACAIRHYVVLGSDVTIGTCSFALSTVEKYSQVSIVYGVIE